MTRFALKLNSLSHQLGNNLSQNEITKCVFFSAKLTFLKTMFKKKNYSAIALHALRAHCVRQRSPSPNGTALNKNICILFYPRETFPSEVYTHGKCSSEFLP